MQIGSTEALKAQMEKCIVSDCKDCPYTDAQICDTAMTKDALEYIESLEERIAIKDEALEALEQRCNALEKLKDPDRIKAIRCKDCRYFEPSNAEEGDNSGYCRNDYAPCQNQTVDAWWYCGSAERVSE